MDLLDLDSLFHPALSDAALEEVVALASIYTPAFVRHAKPDAPAAEYRLVLPVDDLPAHLHPSLVIALPTAYPAALPPRVAHWHATPLWSNDMRRAAEDKVAEMWTAGCERKDGHGEPGCTHDVVCFEFLEWLREYTLEMVGPIAEAMAAAGGSGSNGATARNGGSGTATPVAPEVAVRDLPDLTISPTPHVDRLYSHADPIVDRKSVFLAHAAYISDATRDPPALLAYLVDHRRIARATHNITAYRLDLPHPTAAGGEVVMQDCDDDGEDAAGKRLLHLLQVTGARNVWVCVSRWYGGIQLGPDRFGHINNVARNVLVEMGAIEDNSNGGGSSGSLNGGGGKKGRKH
ncbi:hypothetical protein H9P43_005259 [Blastocladiella emersonii ATCC 22665]|nr:hypothetical protein H9P43_005259 [Blastocladiella emersonii ATCC 22665]